MPRIVFILAFLLACSGCNHASKSNIPKFVDVAFENTSELTLYSLDPHETFRRMVTNETAQNDSNGETFEGWVVLGQTTTANHDEIERLTTAIRADIIAHENFIGDTPPCKFQPRHAIRLDNDNKKIDLVICFECMLVEYVVDGENRGQSGAMSTSRVVFNEFLIGHGIPLPNK